MLSSSSVGLTAVFPCDSGAAPSESRTGRRKKPEPTRAAEMSAASATRRPRFRPRFASSCGTPDPESGATRVRRKMPQRAGACVWAVREARPRPEAAACESAAGEARSARTVLLHRHPNVAVAAPGLVMAIVAAARSAAASRKASGSFVMAAGRSWASNSAQVWRA